MAESIICKSTVALLKRHYQKVREYHDAKEQTAEWEDWVEDSGQPQWDKWAARQKDEPMPLLQTSTKLSLNHQKAFRNCAKDGTSLEGVSIASILPDTLRPDLASSSSAWHKVDESETLPPKKKQNKITTMTTITNLGAVALTQEEKDTRDSKWL